jgi:hypothetical protein
MVNGSLSNLTTDSGPQPTIERLSGLCCALHTELRIALGDLIENAELKISMTCPVEAVMSQKNTAIAPPCYRKHFSSTRGQTGGCRR